jgi:hypothetical protein
MALGSVVPTARGEAGTSWNSEWAVMQILRQVPEVIQLVIVRCQVDYHAKPMALGSVVPTTMERRAPIGKVEWVGHADIAPGP